MEAITEGCHNIASACLSKDAYGQLEADLTKHAYDLRLTQLPYPPRFRGVCGAVRPKGFVVVPNGDLHKCWIRSACRTGRVGTVFDLDALGKGRARADLAAVDPVRKRDLPGLQATARLRRVLVYKFLNPDQTLGEAASLPCPSWKYNINERLLLTAQRSGALSEDDYQLDQIRTDPVVVVCNRRARCAVRFVVQPSTPLAGRGRVSRSGKRTEEDASGCALDTSGVSECILDYCGTAACGVDVGSLNACGLDVCGAAKPP